MTRPSDRYQIRRPDRQVIRSRTVAGLPAARPRNATPPPDLGRCRNVVRAHAAARNGDPPGARCLAKQLASALNTFGGYGSRVSIRRASAALTGQPTVGRQTSGKTHCGAAVGGRARRSAPRASLRQFDPRGRWAGVVGCDEPLRDLVLVCGLADGFTKRPIATIVVPADSHIVGLTGLDSDG